MIRTFKIGFCFGVAITTAIIAMAMAANERFLLGGGFIVAAILAAWQGCYLLTTARRSY